MAQFSTAITLFPSSNMTVPSMPHPGRVTVYIVCSEDDLSGGVAQLSCLVALPGVRTCDIPKISKKAREVQGV